MKWLTDACKYKEASLDDEEEIKKVLAWGLSADGGLSLPIVPTKKSIDNFFALEIRGPIINFDPVFLIYTTGASGAVGLSCAATGLNEVYDFSEKIGFGVITIIKEEHRQKGIATKIREKTLEHLREKGCKKVLTDISISNKASIIGCENIVKAKDLEYNIISNKYECKI